jgi:hypothetical protein
LPTGERLQLVTCSNANEQCGACSKSSSRGTALTFQKYNQRFCTWFNICTSVTSAHQHSKLLRSPWAIPDATSTRQSNAPGRIDHRALHTGRNALVKRTRFRNDPAGNCGSHLAPGLTAPPRLRPRGRGPDALAFCWLHPAPPASASALSAQASASSAASSVFCCSLVATLALARSSAPKAAAAGAPAPCDRSTPHACTTVTAPAWMSGMHGGAAATAVRLGAATALTPPPGPAEAL